MKVITAHRFEDVIDVLRKYEPQKIEIANDPTTLRIGWKIVHEDVWITTALPEAKARWPESIYALALDEEGREKLLDLLYKEAWGV